MALNEEVISFLEGFFSQREGVEALGNIRKVDLVAEGYMDSLDILSLAAQLEIAFGVKLDFSDSQTFINMRQFDTIVKLIGK